VATPFVFWHPLLLNPGDGPVVNIEVFRHLVMLSMLNCSYSTRL